MVDVEGAAARERPPEHDAKPGRLCLQPTGDRGFESISLQQRVYCEPAEFIVGCLASTALWTDFGARSAPPSSDTPSTWCARFSPAPGRLPRRMIPRS